MRPVAADERRGTENAPLLSVVTETEAASMERPEPPDRVGEPTGTDRGRGGGHEAGGGGGGDGGGGAPPSRRGTAWWRAERLLPHGLRAVTFIPLVALALILAGLLWKALPAIRFNGAGFFTQTQWNVGNLYAPLVTTNGVTHPPSASYGALPFIVGTLVSSAIAL